MFYIFLKHWLKGQVPKDQNPLISSDYSPSKINILYSKCFFTDLHAEIVIEGHAGLNAVESVWGSNFTSTCLTWQPETFLALFPG